MLFPGLVHDRPPVFALVLKHRESEQNACVEEFFGLIVCCPCGRCGVLVFVVKEPPYFIKDRVEGVHGGKEQDGLRSEACGSF